MPNVIDGPSTSLFTPLRMRGRGLVRLTAAALPEAMAAAVEHAPSGPCICWGMPFDISKVAVAASAPLVVNFDPVRAPWLVFMHTSDPRPLDTDASGMPTVKSGYGRLGEHAANYFVLYADGSEKCIGIRRRHQISAFQRPWGENCFEAVGHAKPRSVPAHHEQMSAGWGWSQTRTSAADGSAWVNWLYAWENLYPRKTVVGVRLEPADGGTVILSAISAGKASANPLRWEERQKAVIRLPRGEEFDGALDEAGRLAQIKLDMGQVISAHPRSIYPDESWPESYNNRIPEVSTREVLVEYAAHPEACFHLVGNKRVPVRKLDGARATGPVRSVASARQHVTIRAVEKDSRRSVPVKLHIHGAAGEYLPPVDRHRIPNPAWFEDYSVDFSHLGIHHCTYIPGETRVELPLGKVYIEVSKGFEIRPVRTVATVTSATDEIVIELDKVLPWRENGWVSADTHVHFLSPHSALLEGAGEGVNVVNLLASQWGELMTNVGDFDGTTTLGSREMGGDGEYLVRVGTENRQHILGHISLLGYEGSIIAPMTTGGPDESALGDPVGCLMTEWAMQCRRQNGVVVIPHFPNPRGETAAALVSGNVDGVEMTAWGNLYGGIDPYSLADWYRYLNSGYLTAAVGGTDKMQATTAVGAIRTYAQLEPGQQFTYEAWKQAIRKARTFATYGPLLEFSVDGHGLGSRIEMGANGGTVAVSWKVASVTVPISRVELVVNGEIRESVGAHGNAPSGVGRMVHPERSRRAMRPYDQYEGSWSVHLDRSSWLALLVRGHYPDKPEIIAAHSSPVVVEVEGSHLVAAADAVTILEQIEGALAYLDTIGTRADDTRYKRMRLVLTSAHRNLHNRLHQAGHYHQHTPVDDHA